jgi:hypothetical protein
MSAPEGVVVIPRADEDPAPIGFTEAVVAPGEGVPEQPVFAATFK